jgi:hypothetical protein
MNHNEQGRFLELRIRVDVLLLMVLAFVYALCKYDIVSLTIFNIMNLTFYGVHIVVNYLTGKYKTVQTAAAVMIDNARVYEPKHNGIDAKSLIKALQIVSQ